MCKKSKNMNKMEQTTNVNAVSRISQGTVFKGEMTSPNDIRIDGHFEGDIRSEGKVVIGEGAFFKGKITCNDLDFWGKAEGDAIVRGILSLHSGCEVSGSVRTQKLFVELGSSFDGSCSMLKGEEAASAAFGGGAAAEKLVADKEKA